MVTSLVVSGHGWLSTAELLADGLRRLGRVRGPLPVDQLTHALVAASLAEDDGADPPTVVAALCHDIGKLLGRENHGPVAAVTLAPFVSADLVEVLWHHEDFQPDHRAPDLVRHHARARHLETRWYALAECFADRWDGPAREPGRGHRPLTHFVDLLHEVCASPRPGWSGAEAALEER